MLPGPALGQVKCGRCCSIVCSLLSPVGRIVFDVISARIYGVSASLLRGILVTHENQILNSLSRHTHTLHTYIHKYLPSFAASLVTHQEKILSHVTHTPSTRIHTYLPSFVDCNSDKNGCECRWKQETTKRSSFLPFHRARCCTQQGQV